MMTLTELKSRVESCKECRLGSATHVFGEGVEHKPTVMFIGEGPGAVEDECGLPFSGPAGQLLRQGITENLLDGEVYLANIVKCRPPGNREPLQDEVAACHKWLAHQVALIDPLLVVSLGNPATKAILGSSMPGITKCAGGLYQTAGGRNVMPMLHPAAPLHNPDYMPQYTKNWEALISHLLKLTGCPF